MRLAGNNSLPHWDPMRGWENISSLDWDLDARLRGNNSLPRLETSMRLWKTIVLPRLGPRCEASRKTIVLPTLGPRVEVRNETRNPSCGEEENGWENSATFNLISK
ncbi:hypothetical protein AVEN_102487-1 [Araneus ventricosus]|uniref:Uncharacterized protein n=1 Tax=Araneus ventricosus TaxID=182803 RepID=A0A4Y2QZ06_ARAVE|nr:hypothetical protein AVEN_102487-1 [Araneus ventricosus]